MHPIMHTVMSRWALLLLLSTTVLLGLSVDSARAQATTASIQGTVVDETDAPLPGVNVVAVHQPTGTRYGTATNPSGRFTIQGMRVGGPYTITASFVGYQTLRREGLRLQLDETAELQFSLTPKTAEMEEVEVVGQRSDAIIDKDRTGAATNVSTEQIEELPAISRSLTDFTRLVPQAQGDGSIAGANSRYNSIQVDGATLDDVFGLGDAVPGSQAGAEPISLDAIEEFNINIAPYDVRSNGFTGGQINAITKSGSNQFEGSFRFKGGTEDFTGDLNGVGTGEFNQAFYVGTLGGPIIEDELFFFVTAELKRESSPLDTRVGVDLPGTNVFREPLALFDELETVFGSTYGYTPGGISPLTQRQDDEKLLVKLDWNINNSHRLTLRNNYVNARDDQGISRSAGSFSFANRQYVFRSRQNSFTAQLNSTISDNMFNEARLVYTRIRDERDVQDAAFPEVTLDLGGGDQIGAGIGRFSQANRLDQDLFEFTNDFTYITGDHTLTVGTNNKFYQFSNLFIQDYYGSYTFESFTVGTDTISAVEALRRGQPSEYQYSYATQAAGSDRPEADFSAFQFGGYVQDEWQATDNLRLTLGLRVDVPVLPDEPTFNETAYEAFGRSTSNVASGNPLWSPRLGFNYDRAFVSEDLSTQIRGGVGIFSGDPPYVFISNQYSNTGADVNRIDVAFDQAGDFYGENAPTEGRRFVPTNIGDNPAAQPLPVNAPFCQDNPGSERCSELLSPVQTTEINLASDDFKYPQTLRANLAVDQELPFGFVATAEGIYSGTINDVTFRNINLEAPEPGGTSDGQYPIQESKYGRPFYGTPGGDVNRVSERFTNAILLENTNDGSQYSLTGEIQRTVREGLGGSLAYTYTRAENVNNGSSSRAISNWQYNENKDINSPRVGTADYEIRHRILGTLNYTLTYADRFGTTIGLIYEGRSGEPFSWIYDGNANGDTQTLNDLVYVPENESDIVLESGNWDLMNAFIEGDDALSDARGSVIERNTARAPWQNILDVRLSQRIRTFDGQRIEFIAEVDNFLNLLNDDWGRIENTSFNNIPAWGFEGYVTPEAVGTAENGRIITEDDVGKPRISFQEETVREKLNGRQFFTSDIASRWRARLSIKYTF